MLVFMFMNTIKECFAIILRGNKEESRLAARKVSKLLYSSSLLDKNQSFDIKNLVKDAPKEYDKISEDWRKENFVMATSVIYYLHDLDDQPDFLFPWLFHLLQHPNGIIRYASVRMFSSEIGPLTVFIRCPDFKWSRLGALSPQKANAILRSLYLGLHELLRILWQPKYKRYKYIDSLPSSSYKSVQMVLDCLEESCGREYLECLVNRL